MYTMHLVMMVLSAALAVPAPFPETGDYGDYGDLIDTKNMQEIVVPQKRAALVLDRLLVALQKALHEGGPTRYETNRDEPRTAPLRIAGMAPNDLTGLQRRGQGTTRGRVLRCYFNAITCF